DVSFPELWTRFQGQSSGKLTSWRAAPRVHTFMGRRAKTGAFLSSGPGFRARVQGRSPLCAPPHESVNSCYRIEPPTGQTCDSALVSSAACCVPPLMKYD